ncbi:MAG: aroE [Pseudonocardiales bacterium]|nr:aroE [Pseudonocardiales bacterium]
MGLQLSAADVDGGSIRFRRAAVLGRPISHSLSPTLHRAAYSALGLIDWTYEAIDCGADELPDLVRAADDRWAGFSVTMPGKRVALAVADHLGRTARLVGAANTLVHRPDGSWLADNTDVDGIIRALIDNGVEVAGTNPVVLGAGGTAQAALVALANLEVSLADVLVRDRDRTGDLRACAARVGIALRIAQFDDPGALSTLTAGGLVVSTLPAHAADGFAELQWTGGTQLLDAIYDPWPTALAVAVAGAGGKIVSGTEMLLFQAAAQVRLMTGRSAPIEAMRSALNDRPGSSPSTLL